MELSLDTRFSDIELADSLDLDGGISLQTYEMIVLGVTNIVGPVVAIVNLPAGLGVYALGFGLCMQAEEYGMSHTNN